MENDRLSLIYPLIAWWFSIVMLNYQRVFCGYVGTWNSTRIRFVIENTPCDGWKMLKARGFTGLNMSWVGKHIKISILGDGIWSWWDFDMINSFFLDAFINLCYNLDCVRTWSIVTMALLIGTIMEQWSLPSNLGGVPKGWRPHRSRPLIFVL